ncbi:MAG: EAL domain-containing protein [Candidatus Accumulibacter sp. UW26]|jgi:diguanylate cyclase (GGDEF)-like protein/PAS domain S-box-containing protein
MTPVISLATGRSRRRKLLLGIGLLTLVILQLFAYQLYLSYREQIREAETTTLNYAAIFETRLDATLRHSDAILQALARSIPARALERPAAAAEIGDLSGELDARLLNFDELVGLRVFDRKGDLLFSSDRAHTPQINAADRDYFRRLRENPGHEPIFSEVLICRASGRPSLIVARALRGPDGVFLGVVSAVLDLKHYLDNFRTVDLDREGSIVLRRSDDHRLVARWPAVSDQLNQALDAAHPVRLSIGRGERRGTLHYAAQTDGIYRIHSFQRLEHYPFYFIIGASLDDVLAGWRQRALVAGVSGCLLLTLLAALLWRLLRSEAREAAVVADLVADVAKRRQVEAESRKLLQAVEQSPAAIVITNRNAEIEYVNPRFTHVTGYSWQEAIGQNPRLLQSGETPPEIYQALWRTLLAGRIWSGVLLNRRKDGTLFWQRGAISPIFDDQGEVTHYLAVQEDVSERRVTEARLRLLAGVFEHSAEAIMVSDRNNRILEVNHAFCRLTGYAADEVRGADPRLLSSGRATAEDYRAMWQSIRETGHWQGEIWDRRKDGSVYPKWLSISTMRGADGDIEHYIGSFVDISERKAWEEKINHLAHFDALTDLPNRSNLQGRLEQALAAARRDSPQRPLAVMFLDLDRFKNINDTLGHHVGDLLLLEVSKRLRSGVRESDVVARLGGDEFVVVLTGADALAAERISGKLLTALSEPYPIDGQCLHTTSSIGIAVFPGDGETVDVLMRNADAAMYHAKAAGRNSARFFTASMNQAAKDRRQLEEDLHLALQKKEFVLHYQPQVDAGCHIIAAEALLRWQHPEHGLVLPGKFIPLAEDTGLIVPIGQWVLETACAQLVQWAAQAPTRELQIAVNVSARQFRQTDFVDQLRQLLQRSGAPPTQLKLELTESLVLDNVSDTIAKMNAIRLIGVTFSLDDFGTGYSSLSYLTRLPLDQIKIDRAFVNRLPDNQSDAVIAQTIVTMGRSLGLKVIAEGVESEAQHQFLDRHGCHGYQGFLFSRPLPIAAFEELLSARRAAPPDDGSA